MTYKAGPEATILPPSKHFPGNFQAHMGKPQVHMVQDVNRTFNIMGNRKPTGLDMFGPLFGWVSNFQQKSFLAICLMHLCHIQFWMGVQFAPSHHQPCGWGMFFSFAILVALVLLATRLSHWALTEHAYSRRLVLWITSSFSLAFSACIGIFNTWTHDMLGWLLRDSLGNVHVVFISPCSKLANPFHPEAEAEGLSPLTFADPTRYIFVLLGREGNGWSQDEVESAAQEPTDVGRFCFFFSEGNQWIRWMTF